MRHRSIETVRANSHIEPIGNTSLFNAEFSTPRNVLKFAPQEHVFMQGDTPKGVHEIISGTVILYKVMVDGRRQIQDFVSKGEFLALTFSDRHDLGAEALTDVETQFVPRRTFEASLQDSPSFRRGVFILISDKLQAAREQALLLGRKSAKERAATFLLFLESRFKDDATDFISIPMSRWDMADYLGLTLETVSRMMNRLKKSDIIDLPQPNRFRILDRDDLIDCAGDTYEDDFLYAA